MSADLSIARIEALLREHKTELARRLITYQDESSQIHTDVSELGFFIEALQKLSAEAGRGDCLSGDDLYFLLKPVKEDLEFILNNAMGDMREAVG